MKERFKELKEIFIEEWFFFLSLLIFFIVMTYDVPYMIETGGGTIDLDDRIQIVDSYQSKGSFNLSYVSSLDAKVSTYLLSHIVKNWELIPMKNVSYSENETFEDVLLRDKIYLNNANENAIRVAYKQAGKSFTVTKTYVSVFYIDKMADTTLKVGDTIISCNGNDFNSADDLKKIIQEANYGDIITFKVIRSGEKIEATGKIQELENTKVVGISLMEKDEYITDPEIKLSFKDSEAGPSGGFTLALAIYNKLVEEDITHGLKIVGTGTISKDGNIGEIGGVEYKLKGAATAKADIFLVPSGDNYQDALKYKEEHKLKIDIIEVHNFNEAIEILKNYKGE